MKANVRAWMPSPGASIISADFVLSTISVCGGFVPKDALNAGITGQLTCGVAYHAAKLFKASPIASEKVDEAGTELHIYS
ncbi:predicted protein [Plenodomus lingam JN3]|uniref:Predicted protein n=1 Tax=Leptosphaeria maculans (strain JN3 / isolate v23.1.3 / race Av1-4-5-6-7-8) TaxID=985895 RepID=E4ZIL1_LEPMJ|nr:predicted protein [Plenodomus lingam JN3]CBX91032.1 predicted protein [Plenodomus lingam JN3]